jgi:hypothetical protein
LLLEEVLEITGPAAEQAEEVFVLLTQAVLNYLLKKEHPLL